MPSLRTACEDEMDAPVRSSEATSDRSNSSSLSPNTRRKARSWLVARISCAQSRYSWTPSAMASRRSSFAATLRRTALLATAKMANATGTGQNAAMPSRQSKATMPTAITSVDMPVPNSCGITCMNMRS